MGRPHLVQLATIEQIEWNSRSESLVTVADDVEPLALGRLPAMRLRVILGGTAWVPGTAVWTVLACAASMLARETVV